MSGDMRVALVFALCLAARPAIAHMVVVPGTSAAGGWERYSLLVPTEKNSDTVRVELRLPLGMQMVAFETKPGWEAAYDAFPIGAAKLRWAGGRIPPGQMMAFDFMAWNPKTARTMAWEATQIYADGSRDRWGGDHDEHGSTTELVATAGSEAAGEQGGGAERHAASAPPRPGGGAEPLPGGHAEEHAHDASGDAEEHGVHDASGHAGDRAHGGGTGAASTGRANDHGARDAAAPDADRRDHVSAGLSLATALALASFTVSLAALAIAVAARRRAAGG